MVAADPMTEIEFEAEVMVLECKYDVDNSLAFEDCF